MLLFLFLLAALEILQGTKSVDGASLVLIPVGSLMSFLCVCVHVSLCLCLYASVSKNDQALAKLEPWTAVSAYSGLISKVQSSAGA